MKSRPTSAKERGVLGHSEGTPSSSISTEGNGSELVSSLDNENGSEAVDAELIDPLSPPLLKTSRVAPVEAAETSESTAILDNTALSIFTERARKRRLIRIANGNNVEDFEM